MPPEVAEKTTFFKVNWSDLDAQLTAMDKYGVEKSLLLYPTSDAHSQLGDWSTLCAIYNEAIAKVVKAHAGRFIGAGILPVDSPDAIPGELNRIKDLGLKAISLASSYDGVYLDDGRFDPVFEFARNNDVPVHVHPQIMRPIGEERVNDPLLTPVLSYVFDVSMSIGKLMMEGTFLNFPDVNFVFAHYGGVLPFLKERFDNTYVMLRDRNYVKDLGKIPSDYFKNVFFDISGSKSKASLLCALEITDAKHIIFGSDWPANRRFDEVIENVRQIDILDEDKRLMLRNPLLLSL